MSLNLAECEKGMPPIRPPIPYVPPTDLHKKGQTEQIKVELPDGMKFQMPTYGSGNNEEYLVHVIAVFDVQQNYWPKPVIFYQERKTLNIFSLLQNLFSNCF